MSSKRRSSKLPIGLGTVLGLLALAFAALPALASATTLDNSAGTPIPVGTVLTAESNNLVFTGATGINFECKKDTLSGKLPTNAPEPKHNVTTATFKNAAGGAACLTNVPGLTVEVATEPNPPNWTVAFQKEDKFTLSSASGAIAITTKFSNGLTCTFSRTTVTGAYNTNVAPATLTVGAGQVFTKSAGSSAECGGSTVLDGSFTVPNVKATNL
jgi:hypothetical protein